jgi:excinuclease ABC subunit B
MQDMDDLDETLAQIEKDMNERAERFEKHDFLVEAQRIRKRVMYDIKMIKETGFVQGIENYSPYFEKRLDGKTPNTLFDYFPDDLLIIVDESHMTVPQL